MIRREFLKNALAVASGLTARTSYAGTPCPPQLDGAGSQECQQSILEQRARSMSDGEFFLSNDGHATAEIPNAPRNTGSPYTWQTRTGFFDPIRRRAHVIGEYYEGGDPYEHHYYDEANNTWATADISAVPQGPSHWRGGCFDVNTGRFFWQREASDNIYWYDPDTDAWAFHSTHAGIAIVGGVGTSPWTTGFHPNLFGSGKPGLLHFNVWEIHAFEFTDYFADPTAGTWTNITSGNWSSGHPMNFMAAGGSCTYLPERDEAIVTGRGGVAAVFAGAGLLTGVDIGNGLEMRTNAQKEIAGNSGTDKMYICIHPRRRGRILVMDAANSSTQHTDDGGQTWQTGPAHPFAENLDNSGQMSVTSLHHHGLVMGITHTGSPSGEARVCFWKPAV